MSVDRFVRFEDEKGATVYGDLPSSLTAGNLEGKSVEVLSGDPFTGFSKSGSQATIKKVCLPYYLLLSQISNIQTLLCPVESTPIFMCIGLNYAHHAKEANVRSSFPFPNNVLLQLTIPLAHRPNLSRRIHQTSRRSRRPVRRHPHPP